MSRIRDVAERAGVSSATVSRVLADKPHVSADVRSRVLAAAEALNYRPNRIARSLRVQRSRFIGLVVSDIQNPFFNRIVRAVEDTVLPHGFAVFLCNTDENPERERLYLDLLRDEQVAGIILTPTQDAAAYRAFVGAGIPLAVIDRQVEGLGVDTVVSNNVEASQAVVTQLAQAGHTRIGAILSDLSISTGRLRLEGYRRALGASGLAFDPELTAFGKPVEAVGYELARRVLTQPLPATALFTGSKLLTLGVLRYLWDHHLRVPEDVALAAFDDPEGLLNTVEMLSVTQPAYDVGLKAAELLLTRMETPERPPELHVLPSSVAWVGRPALT